MCDSLVGKGYNRSFVKKTLGGHVGFLWGDTLKDKCPRTNNRTPFLVTFYPALPNIGGILHKLNPVLHSSRHCQGAIEQVPMVAFRRSKYFKDILVHSELVIPVTNRGCFKCRDSRCRACDFMDTSAVFKSKVNGRNYFI